MPNTDRARPPDQPSPSRPVIYGEVLFDNFPDGNAVLGGAPFNVAWHLQGFGLEPLFISRVGRDAAGEQVVRAMSEWGMDDSGLQFDDAHPTGSVEIALKQGQPTFTILADQAYDHIDSDQALAAAAILTPPLIYYGSLISRAPVAAATLARLRGQDWPVFVDINLRAPWWTNESVAAALRGAAWVKLNDDELITIAGPAEAQSADLAQLHRVARQLCRDYGLRQLIVTRGEAGAFIVADDTILEGPPAGVERLVDTVGAGDAFSSVVVLGLVRQWSTQVILARALEFAALVCGLQGATTEERTLYEACLERWCSG